MTSQNELAENFANGATSGTASNMFIENDKIFSYGQHFCMAIRLSNEKFLINGDKYSSTTSAHQSSVRQHCNGFIIPFSTLRTAFGSAAIMAKHAEFLDQRSDSTREIPYKDPKTGEQKYRTEHLLGAALFKTKMPRKRKWRYFLSSTDDGAKNWGMGYFLVELPEPVNTVTEAFESLMPKEVKEKEYIRQGEFFFVPQPKIETKNLQIKKDNIAGYRAYFPEEQQHDYITHLTRTKIEKAINEAKKNNPKLKVEIQTTKEQRHKHVDLAPIFGNDSGNPHIATEMRFLDKVPLVRGTIRHPQHKMANLGKIWHEIHINNAVNSWSNEGNVD